MIPKNFNLGYACICTELKDQGIFTSRTLRLETLKQKGVGYAKELALQNLHDLLTILAWNKAHDITLFRMSSEMFPFASHLVYGYNLEFANTLLKRIGNFAKANGIRLTMHPTHFNNFASPYKAVIDNTIADIKHHAEILDRMGLDQNSVLVLHIGGTYDDKAAAIERLYKNIKKLPKKVFARIVFENDEHNYTVEDILPISEKLQIPIVMDFHHDSINPSSKPIWHYFGRVFKVWANRGIKPKIHISNSVPGVTVDDNTHVRRKHSDLITFIHAAALRIKFPIDVMFESKLKEKSIFVLRNSAH